MAIQKGFIEVKARIYPFNIQCRHMFQAVGFHEETDEWFVFQLGKDGSAGVFLETESEKKTRFQTQRKEHDEN